MSATDTCTRPDCGHTEADHSDLSGCLAPTGTRTYCRCTGYVARPVNADDLAHPLRYVMGLEQGRALRDEGIARAGDGAIGALAETWRANAADAMASLIARGGEFSADDLVAIAGEPPRPNMLGALFMAAARQDRINAVGFHQSTRPSCRARVQRTWRAA